MRWALFLLITPLVFALSTTQLPGFYFTFGSSFFGPFKVVKGSGIAPIPLVPYQVNGGSGSCTYGWWSDLLGASQANEAGVTGKGVKVLIIDSGVDEKTIENFFGRKVDWYYNASYEAYKESCSTNPKYIKVDNITFCVIEEGTLGWRKVYYAVPLNSTTDIMGHGTAVASMILSIAPNVTLYVAKVGIAVIVTDQNGKPLEVGYSVDPVSLSLALYKATSGPDGEPGTSDDPDLVNMSLGAVAALEHPFAIDLVGDLLEYYLMKLPIDENSGRMIFIAAAGNSAENIPSTPAIYSDVWAISAVRYDGNYEPAFYTNKGIGIDFAGIGSGVYLPVPNYSVIAKLVQDPCAKEGNGYVMLRLDGTSFAAPMVTGIAALYLQLGIKKSSLKSVMSENAIDVPPKGKDIYTGYGVPQAPPSNLISSSSEGNSEGSSTSVSGVWLLPFLLNAFRRLRNRS